MSPFITCQSLVAQLFNRARTCSPFTWNSQFPLQIGSTARAAFHLSGQARMGPILLQSGNEIIIFLALSPCQVTTDSFFYLSGIPRAGRIAPQEPASLYRHEPNRFESGTANSSCKLHWCSRRQLDRNAWLRFLAWPGRIRRVRYMPLIWTAHVGQYREWAEHSSVSFLSLRASAETSQYRSARWPFYFAADWFCVLRRRLFFLRRNRKQFANERVSLSFFLMTSATLPLRDRAPTWSQLLHIRPGLVPSAAGSRRLRPRRDDRNLGVCPQPKPRDYQADQSFSNRGT